MQVLLSKQWTIALRSSRRCLKFPSVISAFNVPYLFSRFFQEGQQLMQEKPELSPIVRKKLEEIRDCWQDLESTTQARARQLFEANKADLVVQSYESLDQRLNQLEDQLAYVDQGQDLTGANNQLKKLQVCRIKIYLCLISFSRPHTLCFKRSPTSASLFLIFQSSISLGRSSAHY